MYNVHTYKGDCDRGGTEHWWWLLALWLCGFGLTADRGVACVRCSIERRQSARLALLWRTKLTPKIMAIEARGPDVSLETNLYTDGDEC